MQEEANRAVEFVCHTFPKQSLRKAAMRYIGLDCGMFRPPDAPVYNAAEDFAKKGTDALEMASAFCRRKGLEIFVSIRMNDTHDNRGAKPPNSHFSLFKQQHPECLMGTMTNRPRYCAFQAVLHGAGGGRHGRGCGWRVLLQH